MLIKKETVDLSFLEAWDKQKIYDYFTLWNGRIEEHAKDEYQRFGMSYLVGDERLLMLDYQLDSLDAIPFGSVWREYFEKDKLSEQVIFQLKFIVDGVGYDYDRLFTRDIKLTYLTSDETKKWKYYDHISKIIEYYFTNVTGIIYFQNRQHRLLSCSLNIQKKILIAGRIPGTGTVFIRLPIWMYFARWRMRFIWTA